jgi:hypothetical protein
LRIVFLERLLVHSPASGVRPARAGSRWTGRRTSCAGAVREHVLDRADKALGLQVAAAHAEGAGIQRRQVGIFLERGVFGVGQLFAAPGHAVFHAFAQGGADFADQGKVLGQRLVGPFEDDHALATLEQVAEHVARERTEHGHIDDADLDPLRFPHVIGNSFGGADHAAHGRRRGILHPRSGRWRPACIHVR